MTSKQAVVGQARSELLAKLVHVIGQHAPNRTAAFLAEEFIDPDAPKRKRGRPKGTKEWMRLTERLDAETLADIILAATLDIWVHADKKPPSMLTVAKSIGWRLRVPKEKRAGVGRALLQFAELAGIITSISKHWQTQRLELSDDTLNSLEVLYQSLLKRMCADGEGLLAKPSTRAPTVRRKRDQLIKPFRPRRGSIPAQAALRIHRTQWRIDPWMRDVVGKVLKERAPLAFSAKGSAGERRQMRHDYGSDVSAFIQARDGPQCGYLPVRWDHRGRLNQVGGALTYTGGSDAARSMLQFAESKLVTDEGRPWLARHLINQYSGEESRRVAIGSELAWIDAHRDLIAFTVADPAAPREGISEPYRFIAACRAWSLAEQNLPVALPVAVDASTSVLQHMALLLRDAELARRVNLWPGERQDFYNAVGEECGQIPLQARKAIPAHKNRKGKHVPAILGRPEILADPKFKEPRDSVKKIAMTGFYGQSPRTAARGIGWDRAARIRMAARSLARTAYGLYEALRRVAAELTSLDTPIRWATPSGWECVTDRRRQTPVRRKTYLPDDEVENYTELVITDRLSGARQGNALTANLIHSLDASLLHIAVASLPEGLSVATAHDSFGTHADDVPAVLSALKSALSEMYAGQDVLGRIWAGWTAQGVTEPVPRRGPWDGRFLRGQYTFC